MGVRREPNIMDTQNPTTFSREDAILGIWFPGGCQVFLGCLGATIIL